MSTPIDGRTTHVRGVGNRSAGGMTTQSHSGSGSGLSATGVASSGGSGTASEGVTGGKGRSGTKAMTGRTSPAVGEFAFKLADIEARLSLMEMGARAGQMSFTSLYDGDLRAYNLLGELKMKIGKQNDGKYGVVYVNGTAPGTPTKPLVSARQLYIVVGWDGKFEGGLDKPSDFARVDVHLSTEGPEFIPTGVTSVGSIYAEGNISIPADMQDFYIKLVAVTLSDVPSAPSEYDFVRPFPATAIAAESIAAVHLASEISLSSTFIAGDPKGAHLEMNASGIAMFRKDQTPTVMFSTEEGNALITGSIQTALASSGKSRIVFNAFPELDWNEIRFYAPGDKNWSSLFASRDREGKDGAIALQGFSSATSTNIMATVLGESSILTGVFAIDRPLPNGQSPFTDGMLASPRMTGLTGAGGPFLIHNYKRAAGGASNSYEDVFFGFQDNTSSSVNGPSALFFHEYVTAAGNRRCAFRNIGADLGMDWGYRDNYSFAFMNYDLSEMVPVFFDAEWLSCGAERKEHIEPLTDYVNPLSIVSQVEPKQYFRKGPDPETYDERAWAPDIHPEDLTPVASAGGDIAVDQIRQARAIAAAEGRTDGMIPSGFRGRREYSKPEYGLIAEEVEVVSPEMVWRDDADKPYLSGQSVRGILWGAVRALNAKVDELTQRLDEMGAA